MKKIIVMLTAVLALAVSSICMAADGGDLNKQQAVCETFMKAFSDTAPVYADVSKGLDPSLKEKLNEAAYAQLQKQVKEKFGRVKEVKFYSFQRFDNADQVTYIASFSKEKLVSVTAGFNKNNKMTSFALAPVKQGEAKK